MFPLSIESLQVDLLSIYLYISIYFYLFLLECLVCAATVYLGEVVVILEMERSRLSTIVYPKNPECFSSGQSYRWDLICYGHKKFGCGTIHNIVDKA